MRCRMLFVCSLLAAALAANAQIQPNTVPTQVPANLDHFNCYLAPGPTQPQVAYLTDQFDAKAGNCEIVGDLRMVLFCNPVQKTYKGAITQILHPADHLAMYRIPPEPIVLRQVTVQNQFGVQNLVTRRAEILAVPSGKALFGPAAPPQLPPIPDPKELDHFKCYDAAGPGVNAALSLTDQFLTYQTRLLEPILFCNPVQKTAVAANVCAGVNTTPISNPTAHLTCYMEVPTPPFQRVVLYNDQFVVPGTLPTVTLGKPEILCVPSLKLAWSPIVPND